MFWGLGPGKRVTCRTAFKVSLKRPCPHINRQLQVGLWYSITFCPLDYQRINVRAMLQLWIHHQILRVLSVFARLAASLEPAPVRQAPRNVSQRKSMLPGSGTWWDTIDQPHLNLGKLKFDMMMTRWLHSDYTEWWKIMNTWKRRAVNHCHRILKRPEVAAVSPWTIPDPISDMDGINHTNQTILLMASTGQRPWHFWHVAEARWHRAVDHARVYWVYCCTHPWESTTIPSSSGYDNPYSWTSD